MQVSKSYNANNTPDVPMNLSEALIGLKAYKEVGQRMALLWHSLDDAIIEPRTNLANTSLPGLKVDDVSTAYRSRSSISPADFDSLSLF